jgi:hypothetical protein
MSLRSYIPDPRRYFPGDEIYNIGIYNFVSSEGGREEVLMHILD